MIICPTCKEEIDNDSRFCDQCGQALVYCKSCGRVGKGRRCIYCGGLMVSAEELEAKNMSSQMPLNTVHNPITTRNTSLQSIITSGSSLVIPMLTMYNGNLDIRIIGENGAIIGRKQGPYSHFFAENLYVSSVHAQLIYTKESGWCIIDKHSSNGTKLNDRHLQPDIPMSLKTGDIVTIANVSMQVTVE